MKKHFVLGGLILMGLVVAMLGLSPDFALAAASDQGCMSSAVRQTAAVLCPGQHP
jgi:hypothetical protein